MPATKTEPPISYPLRGIDYELWARMKARAALEGFTIKNVVIALLQYYVKHGLPKA
jgi:hypothetical protein